MYSAIVLPFLLFLVVLPLDEQPATGPDDLSSLCSSFQSVPRHAVDQRKEILGRIALINSRAAHEFLARCASDDFSPEVRIHAFSLWAPSRTEFEIATFLYNQKKCSTMDSMVNSLAGMPGVDAFSVLITLFRRLEDPVQIDTVARLLASQGSKQAFSVLKEAWTACSDPSLGVTLLKNTLSMSHARDEEFLFSLVISRRTYARYYGIKELVKFFPARHVETAGKILGTERDARVRLGALEALASTGSPSAAGAVYRAADRQPPSLLRRSIAALRSMPLFSVRSGLPDTWCETGSPQRFLCAALALAYQGDRSIIKILEKKASKGKEEERVGAAFALSLLGEEPTTLHNLMGRGKKEDRWIRLETIEELALRSPAVTEKLISLVEKGGSDTVRVKAAQVLGAFQASEAIEALDRCLDAGSEPVRIAAIRALGAMGKRECVPILLGKISHAKDRTLDEICGALRRLAGRDFGTDPKGWKKWWAQSHENFVPRGDLPSFSGGPPWPEPVFAPKPSDSPRYAFYGLEIAGGGSGLNNIVFVLDISASMNGKPLNDLKRKFERVLNSLNASSRVNVIVFSAHWRKWKKRITPMTDRYNKPSLRRFVSGLLAETSTNLYDALVEAMKDDMVNRIIVLTDGNPTSGTVTDKNTIIEKISRLNRTRQIRIDTIALGGADREFLSALATRNGGTSISYDG